MTAAIIYILYAVSTGNLPDFTALAAFTTPEACQSAAAEVNKAVGSGEYKKTMLCLTSDSLNELADKNKISQQ
jgi:hypothetical protein